MKPAKRSPSDLNLLLCCGAAAAAVFVLDLWLVPESIAGALHALPVLLASRVSRRVAGIVAGACAVLACMAWGIAVGAGSPVSLAISLVVIGAAAGVAFWPAAGGEMDDVHRQLQDSWYEAQMRAATLEELARELDEARTRALEAARTKSEFLANMSHEIRTPMTAILGSSEVLLDLIDAETASADVTDLLASIRVNGEHLLSLLNDILSLSKIEAGKLPTEQVRCSPAQLAFETRRVLGARARQKGLTFKVEFPTAVPEWTETDPTRVRHPPQPGGQCHQVHRGGRDRSARGIRRQPGDPASGVRGDRHRHRDEPGAAGSRVRSVPAGRELDLASLRRHRTRAHDLAPHGGAPGR